MISKLAKAQENWLFKCIFIAVAISFISLFGVTGYINTAAQNQEIVNVGGKKTPNGIRFQSDKEIIFHRIPTSHLPNNKATMLQNTFFNSEFS